jgi:ArsR family transcriptional regulator
MKCKCCNKKEIEKFAKTLAVMAEPNRLKLLCFLSKCEHCVCEAEEALNLPQNLISHHLKVLRDAGLVTFKKRAQWKHYSVNKKAIKDFKKFLTQRNYF